MKMFFANKLKCLGWILLILCHLNPYKAFSQRTEEFVFPTPSIAEAMQRVRVYVPKDYDEMSPERYRFFIYFGGGGVTEGIWMSSRVTGAATSLISKGEIQPAVFVFPVVQFPDTRGKPAYGNNHMYANSEYFGAYEDVITKDLLNWLKSTSEFNLKDKIIFERNSMAIGGFSRGGVSATSICLRNPGLFIGAMAHGSTPSLAAPLFDEYVIPDVLSENQKNAKGEYEFDAENGGDTELLFGMSAAWNDLDDNGRIQFLIHPIGTLISRILDEWRRRADPYTLIRRTPLYTEPSNSPYIFLEVGERDVFSKPFNDYFVNND